MSIGCLLLVENFVTCLFISRKILTCLIVLAVIFEVRREEDWDELN